MAKGVITEKKLQSDLKNLTAFLGRKEVYIDRIYYCPHHPEKGFKNENKFYKKKCSCRKPNNGMFLKAIKDLNIDIKNSYMIGDRLTDYMAAKKTNIKFIGIKKNKDDFFPKNVKHKKNLLSAIKHIF